MPAQGEGGGSTYGQVPALEAQLGRGFSGSASGFMNTRGFVLSLGAEGGPARSLGRGCFGAGSPGVSSGGGPPDGGALGSSSFQFSSDRHANESRHTREIQTPALRPVIASLALQGRNRESPVAILRVCFFAGLSDARVIFWR